MANLRIMPVFSYILHVSAIISCYAVIVKEALVMAHAYVVVGEFTSASPAHWMETTSLWHARACLCTSCQIQSARATKSERCTTSADGDPNLSSSHKCCVAYHDCNKGRALLATVLPGL